MGTSPGIVIRDRPGLYPLLLSLDGVRDLDALRRNARREIPELDVDVVDALAPLIVAGAVVDAARPPQRALRWALRVELAHDRPSAPLAHGLGPLLESLGIAVGTDADLLVILSSGEPDRVALADVVRSRLPHLVVVQDTDSVRIGPMVVPGHTPCVGCADLHRSSWDPGWSALVPQFGRAVPSGVPALTTHAAAVEVAAACADFADPASSRLARAIVTVGPDRSVRSLGLPSFHPRCACSLLCAA
ncbi:MAG TPA: hypothetical protein VM093_01190 [Aeromicrobium sp.]|nr:hypothetical protein [Aeromicrobium sp.]